MYNNENNNVTKEFITCFKNSDCIHVDINNNGVQITLSKKIEDPNYPDDYTYLRRTFNGFSGHISEDSWNKYGKRTAKFYQSYTKNYSNIAALINLLKPGDKLYFEAMDNFNQYLKDKDLHHDTLFVTIRRKGKEFINNLELISLVCPDNTCRAIS